MMEAKYFIFILFLCLGLQNTEGLYSNEKIVGGKLSNIKDRPYHASIQTTDSEHICSAAILQINMVITTAQCTKSLRGPLRVRVGSNRTDSGGQVYKVAGWIEHPKFDQKTLDNDIGLVFLYELIKYNDDVTYIELAKDKEDMPVGAVATLSGWGATEEGGPLSEYLHEVDLKIQSQETCRNSYHDTILESMFCAGENGLDACVGDSGAPLIYNNKLIGLVSWGVGCGRPNYPGVYTNIVYNWDWIYH